MEAKTRLLTAGLLVGMIAGVSLAQRPAPIDVQLMAVDLARLDEQVKEIDRQQHATLEWIAATDRQTVQDDIPGMQRVLQKDIEWLTWMVRGCAGGVGLLLLETLGRYMLRKGK